MVTDFPRQVFSNPNVELAAKRVDMMLCSDVCVVVIAPLVNRIGSAFSDGVRGGSNIPFEVELPSIHRVVEDEFLFRAWAHVAFSICCFGHLQIHSPDLIESIASHLMCYHEFVFS